jgi:hypothetical protein
VSKASITVCPAIGLHDGDTVTITGSHFHPIYLKKPEGLLYMQCDYKGENSNNYGSADCNIKILKLDPNAAQVRSDGTVGPLYLKVFTSFRSKTLGAKRMDCTVAQCMVTVAQPVQSDDADNPHVVIRFG